VSSLAVAVCKVRSVSKTETSTWRTWRGTTMVLVSRQSNYWYQFATFDLQTCRIVPDHFAPQSHKDPWRIEIGNAELIQGQNLLDSDVSNMFLRWDRDFRGSCASATLSDRRLQILYDSDHPAALRNLLEYWEVSAWEYHESSVVIGSGFCCSSAKTSDWKMQDAAWMLLARYRFQ
jgi:hypothetical protein